jgi:phosphotransferase system enzyme I (PtsI)
MSFTLHGLPVSGGIAIGRAHLMSHATLEVSHLVIAPRLVEKEVARFEEALLRVHEEFASLKERLHNSPGEFGAFIDLHTMILADPELADTPKQLIRERRCNAEWALVQQMEVLVGQFESFEDQYLRERSYDVRQVVERVIKELVGQPGRVALRTSKGVKEEDLIIVAHDLSPADVIAYKDHHVAAFVTDVGGSTSHTAILARSLRIPAVLGLHNARQLIQDKENLIVDGTRGVLIVNPDARILDEYRLRKSQIELERTKLRRLKTAKSSTLDGVDIALHANIELPGDVANALDGGAEGVGLFRTEFLFLDRGDMPTEDEQFEAYRTVVKGMGGRPVTIPYFRSRLRQGPASGESGRRPYAKQSGAWPARDPLVAGRIEMFQTQLRAILRATQFGKIKLLIPMLSQAHEIDQTLAAIERAKATLRSENCPFNEEIEVGAMIEIPAAALAVGLFLRRLHFLSIGTNDLIQYTLAIDRSDEQVAHLYDPLHPAVLMLLAHTIASAEKVHIPVSICGELAGDPLLTRLLLGMGLRQFSMHPAQILSVKQRIMQSNCAELAPIVRRMLRHEEPGKIREQLEKLNT